VLELRIEMGSIISVYRLFTVAERAKLGVLVVLIVTAGFLEVFGVGVLFSVCLRSPRPEPDRTT